MNDQSLRLSLKLFFFTLKRHSYKFTLEALPTKQKQNKKTSKFHQYQIMRAFISLILSVSVLNVFYR